MPLALPTQLDVVRHLGYPVMGLQRFNPSGGTLMDVTVGYRFLQAYGQLLYRLQTLAPAEEATLTGSAFADVVLMGTPAPGNTVSITFSGNPPLASPVTITYTVGANDTLLTIAVGLAALIAGNATLAAAGFFAAAPYGAGTYARTIIPMPEIGITNPVPFTAAVSFSGATVPQLAYSGKVIPPNTVIPILTTGGFVNTAFNGYLPILDQLEGATPTTSGNQDTIQADVWKWNPKELENREKLYKFWRIRLGRFLEIPLYENTQASQRAYGFARRA
jgi:hypothetical protein